MLSVKRKIAKNHDNMATQTESYVNFRWGDNGNSSNSRSKTIHRQSAAIKAPPLIVRKLVGATDGAIKDFVVNRAHYKRQYLRFVHLCCEEDSKKDKGIAARFLLDLISKAMQKVLVERSKQCEAQEDKPEDKPENAKLLYEVSVRVYDCKNFEYPNNEEWDLYDGVLWSGSTFAANRNDELWVIRLKDEIRRKIIPDKRKTLVVSLGLDQTQEMMTNDKPTDKPPLFFQNSCSKLIASASNKEGEEKHVDDEEPFMVRVQATQEFNIWNKPSSPSPASIDEMSSEHEETSDETTYNVVDHIAETCEKFGWFPSVDLYRALARKIVSNSSFSTLGSYGSIPSVGSSLQFYKNNNCNSFTSFAPRHGKSVNTRKVYFSNGSSRNSSRTNLSHLEER